MLRASSWASKTIQEVGRAIYAEILAVAAGKLTKSEIHGHYEA